MISHPVWKGERMISLDGYSDSTLMNVISDMERKIKEDTKEYKRRMSERRKLISELRKELKRRENNNER